MPVKKTNKAKKTTKSTKPTKKKVDTTPVLEAEMKSACMSGCGGGARKIFLALFGVLLAYLIILVGTEIRNNLEEFDYIGITDRFERTLVVEADAKVVATPDIAMTTIGMYQQAETVEEAQKKNAEVMNKVIARLKDLQIPDADIKTDNYNMYPMYNYEDGGERELIGYGVDQNVTVKIRDLDKVNTVVALAGEVGANSVSGVQFVLDDREVYLAQARQEAIEKIGKKARDLSQMLGVKLVGVVSYDEYEAGGGAPYSAMLREEAVGFGGELTPKIEPGSMDIKLNVSVTFEIK